MITRARLEAVVDDISRRATRRGGRLFLAGADTDPCWPVWQHPHCFADPRWQALAGFSDDARTAITQAPDYFVRWYTLKSIGLGVAVGVIGFLIGRATAKR